MATTTTTTIVTTCNGLVDPAECVDSDCDNDDIFEADLAASNCPVKCDTCKPPTTKTTTTTQTTVTQTSTTTTTLPCIDNNEQIASYFEAFSVTSIQTCADVASLCRASVSCPLGTAGCPGNDVQTMLDLGFDSDFFGSVCVLTCTQCTPEPTESP